MEEITTVNHSILMRPFSLIGNLHATIPMSCAPSEAASASVGYRFRYRMAKGTPGYLEFVGFIVIDSRHGWRRQRWWV